MRTSAIEYGVTCDGRDCGNYAEECHEILAGSYRKAAMAEPRTHMHLCHACHERLQGRPYIEQASEVCLAVLDAINRCYGTRGVVVDVEGLIEELRKELP